MGDKMGGARKLRIQSTVGMQVVGPNFRAGQGPCVRIVDVTVIESVAALVADSQNVSDTGVDAFEKLVEEAPLPSVGIRGQYRFGEKWRFVGKINWLDVSAGEHRGTFSDTLLTMEHDTWDRVGLGFGINSFGLKLESRDSGLRGIVDINFDSLVVYFNGHFGRD